MQNVIGFILGADARALDRAWGTDLLSLLILVCHFLSISEVSKSSEEWLCILQWRKQMTLSYERYWDTVVQPRNKKKGFFERLFMDELLRLDS